MEMEQLYDVIVIGGGPAGLTAALYLARARYRVLVVEKEHFGGQITITNEIVNYPGVAKTSGRELTDTMRQQAEGFGAEFLLAEVTAFELDGDVKTVKTGRGEYRCFGVLLATGAHPRMIGFPGEAEFRGRGIAYCATCDGEFFTGKEVFVIGGGFAAAEESVFLTRYAKHVTVLIRGEDFTCAEAVSRAAKEHPKITVRSHTAVVEATGDTALRSLRYRDLKTGEETVFAPHGGTFGVFVFAGYEPETALIRDKIETDPRGYIVTDGSQRTSLEGVYAAGDVCEGAAAGGHRRGRRRKGCDGAGKVANAASDGESRPEGIFTQQVMQQLEAVFERMQEPLILELYLDEKAISTELRSYMEELAQLTPKLTVRKSTDGAEHVPLVRVLRSDGSDSGLAFHGVPGGHEFTSFIMGLYNVAGPGQALDEETMDRIKALDAPTDMQIFVSLSCTMCPELVIAAQHIAALNPNVRAEAYDLNHFPALKETYNVMSVPCLVLNSEKVLFGKKSISQLLDTLEQQE